MGGKSSRPAKSKEDKSEPAANRERNEGYSQVDEEQFSQNRQKDLNNKLSNGQHASLTGKLSEEETEEASGAAAKAAASAAPTRTRVHPYDEINLGESNLSKAVSSPKPEVPDSVNESEQVEYTAVTKPDKKHKDKKNNTDKKLGKTNKMKDKKSAEVDVQKEANEKKESIAVMEETEAEYTNIQAIKAAAVDELYAKPLKPKKNVAKEELAKQLNYIEVVVAPKTGKAETKPQSPNTVTYSNVIKKEDGKLVLVADPS
ncbi:hypothetical protein Btru_066416 [Bulinus truncatus]|nr:hypothetical protein Btru_066416 [Bulinus truncatus]